MILVAASPEAGHAVDVTATFELGVDSLRAHTAYLAGLGDHAMADPSEFLEAFARQTGARLGVPMAVSFELLGV